MYYKIGMPLLAALLPFFLQAQPEWKLHKDKEGIQVYFRESEQSNIKELKITMQMQASISSVVACLRDVEHYAEWMDHCLVVKKLKEESPFSYVYYNLANFPWPLADREFVMRCTMYQDPKTLEFFIQSEAAPTFIPIVKRYVRVRETTSKWRLIPQGDGMLRLEYYLRSDPGGAIPAWMVNMALESGPLKTMKQLSKAVQTERFRTAQLAEVREPD